jgi:hypothetical protein
MECGIRREREAGLDALKTPFIGARMGNTADSCDGIGRFVCNL